MLISIPESMVRCAVQGGHHGHSGRCRGANPYRAVADRLTEVSTPVPAVSPTGWALHGRVYNAGQVPQERYTVFLVDPQKNYLSEYGFSYTDATGYFLINYPGLADQVASDASPTSSPSNPASPKSGASPRSRPTGEEVEVETPRDADDDTYNSSGSTPPKSYIQVYDPNANPVLSSTSPFTPVIGQARYQLLTLPTAQQALGDPPAKVRAVAGPQTGMPATNPTAATPDATERTKSTGDSES